MKRHLLIAVLLAGVTTAAQAESNDADSSRFRWDIAAGLSKVSGGHVGLANSVTLAYDNADRRFSYRYVEYSDRAVFGGKGICPLGCGHQDLLDTHELLYGWLVTSGMTRFSLQSGIGNTRAQGYFGDLGRISEPTLPIVAGIVVGDARYLRFKLEAEYVLNQSQPYFGLLLAVMLGSVW